MPLDTDVPNRSSSVTLRTKLNLVRESTDRVRGNGSGTGSGGLGKGMLEYWGKRERCGYSCYDRSTVANVVGERKENTLDFCE
ncbi:hypothetical protein V1477_007431 [Vespula maculifrons]|uniref:Uncharacterized protein n=2 Tax=Vespula TaxID=7451 RepID=A0A834JTT0_VESVU|nr:hypothetical protein HZH66_007787 [Vespula vulgaris]